MREHDLHPDIEDIDDPLVGLICRYAAEVNAGTVTMEFILIGDGPTGLIIEKGGTRTTYLFTRPTMGT